MAERPFLAVEALQADHGDCLLLRWGTAARPHLMVIDGGPGGIYERSLLPRLRQLKRESSPDAPLTIDMVMVSHLDDDHINGIVDLLKGMADPGRDPAVREWSVGRLWHNSFDDLVGQDRSGPAERLVRAGLQARPLLPGRLAALVESVGQARNLRDLADRLEIPVNAPFDKLVLAPDKGRRTVRLGGLAMTVVAPSDSRVAALQEFWDRNLRAPTRTGRAELVARYEDDSVPNLASVVVLARFARRTVLLTGDARGDHILEGLGASGLVQGDAAFHVDVLKVPHHGSDHNVETDFFARVTADHYVISANGDYGNPEPATLQMILEARGGAAYTIHLTNMTPRVRAFLQRQQRPGVRWRVSVRASRARGLTVALV